LANTARDAAVGQAKNRSPIHSLTRFRARPDEMLRIIATSIEFPEWALLKTSKLPSFQRRLESSPQQDQ
jgi:hypothetical protein